MDNLLVRGSHRGLGARSAGFRWSIKKTFSAYGMGMNYEFSASKR